MILNPMGFTLGSLHGATDHGFVPSAIPGYIGLILGDLVFGMMVGFVQQLAFRRAGLPLGSAQWIVANAVGFTLGARAGAFLTFRLTDDWLTAGIIFGMFMGGSIGLATAFALYKQISLSRLFAWLITCIFAWVVGEKIAFASLFSIKTAPLVGAAIAGVTGLALIFILSPLRAEKQPAAEPKRSMHPPQTRPDPD
ncbi:MAG: hypothetical protein L6Q26_11715 [Anaerolineales bacterium]|nr:hypothetical protein [Anaerolineales bacterium]